MRDYNSIPFRPPSKKVTAGPTSTSSQASLSPRTDVVSMTSSEFSSLSPSHLRTTNINANRLNEIHRPDMASHHGNQKQISRSDNEEEKKDEPSATIVLSPTASMSMSTLASQQDSQQQLESHSHQLMQQNQFTPNRPTSLPPAHSNHRNENSPYISQQNHSAHKSQLPQPQHRRRSSEQPLKLQSREPSPQQQLQKQQQLHQRQPSQLPQPQQRRTSSASSNKQRHMSPQSLPSPQQLQLSPQSLSSPSQQQDQKNQQQQQQQQQQQSVVSPFSVSSSKSLSPSSHNSTPDQSQQQQQSDENSSTYNQSSSPVLGNNQGKSADAMILELRSSVRQLKRQLQQVNGERDNLTQKLALTLEKSDISRSVDGHDDARLGELQVQLDRAHAQIITADMVRKELEDTLEAEQYTWELRVQDQERSLEQLQQECAELSEELQECRSQWKKAEQEWKDQVQELQNNLDKSQQEAKHWRTLQSQQDSQDVSELKQRLLDLEQERAELQGCLDEALKELEAVDAELQADNNGSSQVQHLRSENERLQQLLRDNEKEMVVALRHLYRWLLEQDQTNHSEDLSTKIRQAKTPQEIITAIQSHLEIFLPTNNDYEKTGVRKQIQELESQLSVYKGDLQAREESSAELRASLKEAVALLKPLQDAVAKTDKEKGKLQERVLDLQAKQKSNNLTDYQHRQEIRRLKDNLAVKEEEIERLREEVQSLEVKLSRANVQAASAFVSVHNNDALSSDNPSESPGVESLSRAREELRAKRATEKTLKQLLRDAQKQFQSLHSQNKEVEALNNTLQDRLVEAETKLDTASSNDSKELEQALKERDTRIQDLEKELKDIRGNLNSRDIEIKSLRHALDDAKSFSQNLPSDDASGAQAQSRILELEEKLAAKSEELVSKRSAERALNRSLKEALSLVKPLQKHLEDAEFEKTELAEQLRAQKMRLGEMDKPTGKNGIHPSPTLAASTYASRSSPKDTALIRELEETVRQLEKENSQLHDAMEDMSQSINASHFSAGSGSAAPTRNEARLKEELVELKSRYEVTQGRLEDAYVENHNLVEALSKREREERSLMDEIKGLRDKLHKTEEDLENVKHIATTSLVRVEELTRANSDRHNSGSWYNSDLDHDAIYKEKLRDLDREMASARILTPQVPYRLT